LHWAASRGHDKLVTLLLSHGADYKLRTQDGWTPLMVAEKEGREEVEQTLRRAGARD
jgi:ankyrin repeat protein